MAGSGNCQGAANTDGYGLTLYWSSKSGSTVDQRRFQTAAQDAILPRNHSESPVIHQLDPIPLERLAHFGGYQRL